MCAGKDGENSVPLHKEKVPRMPRVLCVNGLSLPKIARLLELKRRDCFFAIDNRQDTYWWLSLQGKCAKGPLGEHQSFQKPCMHEPRFNTLQQRTTITIFLQSRVPDLWACRWAREVQTQCWSLVTIRWSPCCVLWVRIIILLHGIESLFVAFAS